MSKPHVSILMPTYNPQAIHLRAAIDSILHQSYPHWSLLIHDDASDTDVRSLVEPYAQDTRITFVRSDRRLGIGGNWNACLRATSGDLIQFLFQDDLWYRDYLEANVNVFLEDASVGLAVSDHAYRAESEESERFLAEAELGLIAMQRRKRLPTSAASGKDFLLWWIGQGLRPNIIGEPSFVMLRRSLTDAVGTFREDMPQTLDLEYWMRALLRTDFRFIPKELGMFRIHTAGASMRNEASGEGLGDRLRCYETLLRLLPKGTDRMLAEKALEKHLASWRRKFFRRVRTKKRVKSGSILRPLCSFARRHPLILLRSLTTSSKR